MWPLLVLSALLLGIWLFGVLQRHDLARFMHDWLHVPLAAGLTTTVFALITIVR